MSSGQIPRIGAIVLAAGTSSRLGRNKLLVEIDGVPILRTIVERAIEAGLDPVLVVFGHQQKLAAAALTGLAYQAVENPQYRRGMTSSLRAGIGALSTDVSAAIMILADMPRVSSEMIAALTRTHLSMRSPLVLCEYGNNDVIQAPPTLFAGELFAEILALPDDGCPRDVVRRHRAESSILRWPRECLRDLDRAEDLSVFIGVG